MMSNYTIEINRSKSKIAIAITLCILIPMAILFSIGTFSFLSDGNIIASIPGFAIVLFLILIIIWSFYSLWIPSKMNLSIDTSGINISSSKKTIWNISWNEISKIVIRSNVITGNKFDNYYVEIHRKNGKKERIDSKFCGYDKIDHVTNFILFYSDKNDIVVLDDLNMREYLRNQC